MEKTLFEIETRITPESCRAVAHAKTDRHCRTIWLTNALIAIGAGVLWAVGSVHAYWITALLAILLLQTAFHLPMTGVWRYSAHGESERTAKILFYEDFFCVRTKAEESRIAYSDITDWMEERRHYVMLIHNHTPIAIERARLTPQQARELESLIARKTGKRLWTARK